MLRDDGVVHLDLAGRPREKGAERINRMAVIPGELRIADRVHCRADELADVIEQGGDVLVRAAWTSARWLEEDGRA